ncbi:MAG: KOW motif-containing protein, partial [Thermoprotei archaeon]
LNIGDEIEVVSGALRGSRGKVLRIDRSRNEVTFQPEEVAIPMPMTISIDVVKIVKQAEKGAVQP